MTAKASLLFVVSVATAAAVTQPAVDFNRDIRRIMSDTCFRCHDPDTSLLKELGG